MVSVLVSHSVRDAPTFADRYKDVSESPVLQVCTFLSVSEFLKASQQALCCLRGSKVVFSTNLPRWTMRRRSPEPCSVPYTSVRLRTAVNIVLISITPKERFASFAAPGIVTEAPPVADEAR